MFHLLPAELAHPPFPFQGVLNCQHWHLLFLVSHLKQHLPKTFRSSSKYFLGLAFTSFAAARAVSMSFATTTPITLETVSMLLFMCFLFPGPDLASVADLVSDKHFLGKLSGCGEVVHPGNVPGKENHPHDDSGILCTCGQQMLRPLAEKALAKHQLSRASRRRIWRAPAQPPTHQELNQECLWCKPIFSFLCCISTINNIANMTC